MIFCNSPRILNPYHITELLHLPLIDGVRRHQDPGYLCLEFPWLKNHITVLASLFPLEDRRKYLTVDIQYREFTPGQNTSDEASWHIDGYDDRYLIFSVGSPRTRFLTTELELGIAPREPAYISREIEKALRYAAPHFITAPESTPVIYTSRDIHAGSIAARAGRRFFLKLRYSDTMRVK